MMSKTISITIPDKLVLDLQREADEIGISRSRFIGNILLEWQTKRNLPTNKCDHQKDKWCDFFQMSCTAPQNEAVTCEGYDHTDNDD